MIPRTASSGRVNITVVSSTYEAGERTSMGSGRPPRPGGPGARAGPPRSSRDSLWVGLGLVAFLAAVGLLFLHRLQRAFDFGTDADDGDVLP
ncbi:hypothetical protein Rsub_06663 [Raphidocelis subcapitata]|uniref:Uncharacterized protein n=1 Tax=Raphidocelis subcapitata TaxID=307507 RepID=A0A2V0P3W6_9CHLO|nr:hypothetical protein Rsub_06663 [Raphidocelis subcapitata]|eukprot:GBF94548.1 hypothetical protein Rsub_06663 [Raphidocelis subcapitata]